MLGRVLGFGLLVSILVGLAGGCVAVLISEPTLDWVPKLLAGRGLIGLVFYGAIVSLPVSIPAGVVGGALAFAMLRRNKVRGSGRSWIVRGAAWGGMLGVFGAFLWFGVASPTRFEEAKVLVVLSLYGGVVGLIAGIIVGVHCKKIRVEAP